MKNKRTGSIVAFRKYTLARSECSIDKKDYTNQKKFNVKSNAKAFYNFENSKLRSSCYPKHLKCG